MLKLKQIELLGFKSFPNKTVVDLDDHVTCVVGPNGSGKSNLADAIQFAFGSQSSRELRTGRLAGLIFAGTDKLRPLNLASVTLHFERTAQDLAQEDSSLLGMGALADDELELPELATASSPAGSQLTERGGYPGHKLTRHHSIHSTTEHDRTPDIIRRLEEMKPGDRISLTRRVFRDGGGGYFLNDEAVRLKDIDRFFNRFNLGRSSVFSISQGEVEKKILETPQELRDWLAEATGVALLMAQKQRAQAKLKKTLQNLERLEDIRTNTRDLVEDLAGQRVKAEQHLKLQTELRAVELNEIRREVEFSQKQQESTSNALNELEKQLSGARATWDEYKAKLEHSQRERGEIEQRLASTVSAVDEQRERVAQLRQQAAVAQERSAAAEQAVAQARTDERDLIEQGEAVKRELDANEENLSKAKQGLDDMRQSTGGFREAFSAAQKDLGEVSTVQSDVSNRIFELAQEQARLNNELSNLDRTEKQLAGQQEARQSQLDSVREKLNTQEVELSTEQKNAEQLALDVGTQRDKLEKINEGLKAASAAIQQADEQCTLKRGAVAELTARRHTLAELEDDSDDDSGTAVLLEDGRFKGKLNRVTGVKFPHELRPAFTRLLAHAGDALVGARDIRSEVREVLAGRGAEALLLSGRPGRELHPQSIWRELNADQNVVAALRQLIGEVVAADGMDEAGELLDRDTAIDAVVLRDGSGLIGRDHAYLGAPSTERALKVARQSDLAYLDGEIVRMREAVTKAEQELAAHRAHHAELQWERDEVSAKLAGAESRLKSTLELCDRLHKSVEDRKGELNLLERQTGQLAEDRAKLSSTRPELERRLKENEEQRRAHETRRNELEAGRSAAEAKLEEARQALADAQGKLSLAEQRAKHLEHAGLDLAERRSNLRAKQVKVGERISALRQEGEEAVKTAQDSNREAEHLTEQLEEAGGAVTELREKRGRLTAAVESLQAKALEASQSVSRLEQDQVGLSGQRDRAIERTGEWLGILRERYSLTLSQLLSDPAITAPPPGAKLDASEAGRGKLREEKARLREMLDEIGTVNLLSIEQHQEHNARLNFLDTQAGELERAVSDLTQLVGDLDSTTEEKYKANLREIERRFNELYLDLFGEGWARLRFENPEQMIESGVEVEVQLPGGRRHSLRSLSGGQRSLIFLSLFFAVHSVRSPGFCILDEADAALDDANVGRYVQIIRKFGLNEQFIVITHNKRTMETADRLVGVVGRPKGVSNLLTVDLKAARKLVDKGVA